MAPKFGSMKFVGITSSIIELVPEGFSLTCGQDLEDADERSESRRVRGKGSFTALGVLSSAKQRALRFRCFSHTTGR